MADYAFTRADLRLMLVRTFAEARAVQQGGSSQEFLFKLMYAVHNIPSVLEKTSDNDPSFWYDGKSRTVNDWAHAYLLPGFRSDEQLTRWLRSQLPGEHHDF